MDHKSAVEVFARLNGMEAPTGVYALYNPALGWCRSMKHIGIYGWSWSKKGKYVDLEAKVDRLVQRLRNVTLDVTVIDLLTLKTWTPAAYIAEFAKKPRVRKFVLPRGICPRCNRDVAFRRTGKPTKHWCRCSQCKTHEVEKCKPGCPHYVVPVTVVSAPLTSLVP